MPCWFITYILCLPPENCYDKLSATDKDLFIHLFCGHNALWHCTQDNSEILCSGNLEEVKLCTMSQKSRYQNVELPNVNLISFLFRNIDKFPDCIAYVSTGFVIIFVWSQHAFNFKNKQRFIQYQRYDDSGNWSGLEWGGVARNRGVLDPPLKTIGL